MTAPPVDRFTHTIPSVLLLYRHYHQDHLSKRRGHHGIGYGMVWRGENEEEMVMNCWEHKRWAGRGEGGEDELRRRNDQLEPAAEERVRCNEEVERHLEASCGTSSTSSSDSHILLPKPRSPRAQHVHFLPELLTPEAMDNRDGEEEDGVKMEDKLLNFIEIWRNFGMQANHRLK